MKTFNATATMPSKGAPQPDLRQPMRTIERVHINNKALDPATTALLIYNEGFIPVPLLPWSDKPAVGLESWTERLSKERICEHWQKFPRHELGFIREEVCETVHQ